MKLTYDQKREILQCLEGDRPLPDKYRFLLFGDNRQVELVWDGKTGEVCNVVLPFQVIEQVDEPRSEEVMRSNLELFTPGGRQLRGWSNKLIWGDNKLILSSLKGGPLRKEIEKEGGIKLIYIDPPFDVGADFSMNIEVGDGALTKEPGILEEIAYRDTWGKGTDSFITMIYERLSLMRDLLADDGSIYVHCDWRVNSYMRLVLDEVFGKENFRNDIVWFYPNSGLKAKSRKFHQVNEVLLNFTKGQKFVWNEQREPFEDGKPKQQPMRKFNPETKKADVVRDENGKIKYIEVKDKLVNSVWRIPMLNIGGEILGYPTQKPEALLERVIKASSNKGDIVADFFCGSGTTAAVAEKLGRKWITSDLGKFAIHTTRKRMIKVQRELKEKEKDWRAFDILNLGKYERQHYIGVNADLPDEQQQKQLAQKESDYRELILKAYSAEAIDSNPAFHGKKAGRMVAIGPVNLPVTRLFAEQIILASREQRISRVDILAFEFEMGLFPNIQQEAKTKGVDLALKYIPREVFDKRAVEKNQVVFHDVSYIGAKLTRKKSGGKETLAVTLTNFSVHYSQGSVKEAAANLKNGGKPKIVVENGKVIRVSKDKSGKETKENLTPKWSDWVDYWAVDFDFESRKEIVREKDPATGKEHERWTGDYIFENEWQSFRTRQSKHLDFTTTPHEVKSGKRCKVAVKVVDIFGNDTMTILEG